MTYAHNNDKLNIALYQHDSLSPMSIFNGKKQSHTRGFFLSFTPRLAYYKWVLFCISKKSKRLYQYTFQMVWLFSFLLFVDLVLLHTHNLTHSRYWLPINPLLLVDDWAARPIISEKATLKIEAKRKLFSIGNLNWRNRTPSPLQFPINPLQIRRWLLLCLVIKSISTRATQNQTRYLLTRGDPSRNMSYYAASGIHFYTIISIVYNNPELDVTTPLPPTHLWKKCNRCFALPNHLWAFPNT